MRSKSMLAGLAALSMLALAGCGHTHNVVGGSSGQPSTNQASTGTGTNTASNASTSASNSTNATSSNGSSSGSDSNSNTSSNNTSSNSSTTNTSSGSTPQSLMASTIQTLLTNPANGPVDCSALVQYVYAQAGVKVPRVVSQQATVGTRVPSKSQLQYGDIVFFDLSNGSQPSTATFDGIYVGNGKFVAKTTHGILSIGINSAYWGDKFLYGQHVI